MGTRMLPTAKPRPRSRSSACTPEAASRPNAEPPESTTASMRSTSRCGASRSVSRSAPGTIPAQQCTAPQELHAAPQPGYTSPMAADVTYLAALLAGVVSFLSPCVLPLVPPYLVYLAGTSLERLAEEEPPPRVRRDTVLAAGLFVLGFATVFVALGASASV